MFQFHKFYEDGKLNKDLVFLLLIGFMYSLGIALSNSFVNVYLWKQTNSFLAIGVYNLIIVVVQPLAFIVAGKLAKKIDRSWVLRVGVIFLALFFISVLVINTRASNFLFLLGACLGMGYGFYWLAFNVLTFEITEPHTRDIFNGFLGLLSSFSGMIGPIVAGFIISRSIGELGYTIIFAISLLLFILGIVFSFFLSRRENEGYFGLKEIWRERKRNRAWRNICNAHVVQGLREGVFFFVISMYVYIVTDSELALGKFGLVSSGVSFVGYYLVTHFLKEKDRKKGILIGGFLLFASVLLVVYHVTYIKLMLYAAVISMAYPLLLVPYTSMTYDVIGKGYKAREFRIEYIIVREIFLNLGRIVSILAFLFALSFFNPKESMPILLLVLGTGHVWIYFFVKDIHSEGNDNRKGKLEVVQNIIKTRDRNG
ncbi:MAG: MFS transporter [Bacillaceae bacterium]